MISKAKKNMKKTIFMLAAMAAMVMVSCEEKAYINGPGANEYVPDTLPVVKLPDAVDYEGADIPDSCLNVIEARKICSQLEDGKETDKKYYVKGWVRKFDSKHESGIESFGNGTFYIAATNDGRSDEAMFEAYQVYAKDGKKFVSLDQIAIGDFVVIYGKLTNFKGTYETVGKGAAYVYYCSNPNFDPKEDPNKLTPDPDGADVPDGTLNVYEARAICDSIGAGKTTSTEYYVKGWVRKLDSKHASGVQQYGNGTFYIAPTNDGSTDGFTFEAYQVYGKNKKKLTSADQVAVGDFVVLKGKLTNYNGTAETVGKGAAYIYYSTNPKW